jgi:hypothetical protein
MWTIIIVSIISWILLTLMRIGVHLFLANGLKIRHSNGHWIYLVPQIILIIAYSYVLVLVFNNFTANAYLALGVIWLFLVLSFEFVGTLVIQKKSMIELFEGWKIWKGHIWTLVLISHLAIPYLLKLLVK